MQRATSYLAAMLMFGFGSNALAATKTNSLKPKAVTVGETFQAGNALCGSIGGNWVPGRSVKGGKFITLAEDIRVMKKRLKLAPSSKKKSFKKKLKVKKALLAAQTLLCVPENKSGPKLPDEFSLDPIGTPTREQLRYLMEKAGFGVSTKEEATIQLGLTQGIAAAVADFMASKAESSTLANRVQDRFDNTLGNLNTQTRNNFSTQGYRRAVLDQAVNTNNPFRENFRHFFLNLWTVGAEVLNNNSNNNPQIPLWWDYWELLGRIAAGPDLPNNLIEIGRHPLMLFYLNNDKNLNGNVNENYARELMELFSLGTHRLDPATGQLLENYVEFREDGRRTEGDIYRIATRFTGWRVSPLVGGDGLLYWRSVYSAADHDPTPRVIFEGNPWAFTAQTDEDVVRGIFASHPAAATYIATELLKWYVTPEPPKELVNEFARIIKEAQFKLDGPMAMLLSSKAFYHPNYSNKIAKNSFQLGVEIMRGLELARGDIGDQAQEVGVNIQNREADIMSMGFATTNPPTVFYFDRGTWTSNDALMFSSNMVANTLSDTQATGRLTGWSTLSILPPAAANSDEAISFVSARLGVTPNASQFSQTKQFLDRTYNGTTYTNRAYNNTDANHRSGKGVYLYLIMAMWPDFITK